MVLSFTVTLKISKLTLIHGSYKFGMRKQTKQEVLENQISHYRNSANNANQRVREYQDWAERAEKAFWFAAILAGVFFVLLLVLGGVYFLGRN